MKKPTKYSIVLILIAITFCYTAKEYITQFRSGELVGEILYWKGETYVPCTGKYIEGKLIGATKDGWQISEVKSDVTHTFIILRSFLDQQLMVKEDYIVPDNGKISLVYWNNAKIDDENFCSSIANILENATTDYQYETDDIFKSNDNQKMRELYVGFDDCPIATKFKGYMGIVDGNWYITTNHPFEYTSNGTRYPYIVYCYSIPQEYSSILGRYFS